MMAWRNPNPYPLYARTLTSRELWLALGVQCALAYGLVLWRFGDTSGVNWWLMVPLTLLTYPLMVAAHQIVHWAVARMVHIRARIVWSGPAVVPHIGAVSTLWQTGLVAIAPLIIVTFGLLPILARTHEPTVVAVLAFIATANARGSLGDIMMMMDLPRYPAGTVLEYCGGEYLVHEPPGTRGVSAMRRRALRIAQLEHLFNVLKSPRTLRRSLDEHGSE